MRTLPLLLWSLPMLSVAHAQPARPLAVTLCVDGDPGLEQPAAARLERSLGGARLSVVAQGACPAGGHVGRFEQAGGRVVFRLRAPGGITVHRAVAGLTSVGQPLSQMQAGGQLSPFGVQLYGLLLEARAERAAQAAQVARRRRARRAPAPRPRARRVAQPTPVAPPAPEPPPMTRRPPPPPEPAVRPPSPPPAPLVARPPEPPRPVPAPTPTPWRAGAWAGARARPTGWAPALGGALGLGAWRLTVDGDLPTDGTWRGLPLRWSAWAVGAGWAPEWSIGRWRLGPRLGVGAEALWAKRLDATDPGGVGWQPVASAGVALAWAHAGWRVGVQAQGRGAWPAEEAQVPGGPRAALAPWGLALGLGLGWAP